MAVSLKTGSRNMRLTQSSRLLPSNSQAEAEAAFPTKQLFSLAICRVAEPIALTSIFPYSWLMVKSFHIGNNNDASLYAGILISAFALSECLTGMFWGALSDRIGRKPVLLLGCTGTMLSVLIVGMARNFWLALAGRVLGGLLNGNVGCIQTMVGELVKRPEHEPRAYSIMPFVWSIGTIIGPAIGGTFAEPAENFPSSFSATGLFARYPYLLPNLICAILMMVSIALAYFFLEETHPHLRSAEDTLPSLVSYDGLETQAPALEAPQERSSMEVGVCAEGYGTFQHVDITVHAVEADQESVEIDLLSEKPVPRDSSSPSIWTYKIIMLLVALGIFSYHSMCFDHLLPIFLQDSADDTPSSVRHLLPPGLGMSTFQVGTILSMSGLSALFIQAIVFPLLASYMPAVRLLLFITLLHPLVYLVMPFLAILPETFVYPGVYSALTFRNFTSIIAYPLLLMLLKQACPSPMVLGKINGIAASVGAAARMVAPPLAGYLYGWGADLGFTGLAWWGSCLVAIAGAGQIFLVKRGRSESGTVSSVIVPAEAMVAELARGGLDIDGPKMDCISIVVLPAADDVETA